MYSTKKIYPIQFSQDEIRLVQTHLHALLQSRRMKGGQAFGLSNYRTNMERNDSTNKGNVLDGITGQAGNYALIKWFYGDNAPGVYEKTRRKANNSPFRGDKGSDIIGFSIDIKTSKIQNKKVVSMKSGSFNPSLYQGMKIFPRERHEGVCYVKGAAILDVEWPEKINDSRYLETLIEINKITVLLFGFIPESLVTQKLTPFSLNRRELQAYHVGIEELFPLEDLYLEDWAYSKQKQA